MDAYVYTKNQFDKYFEMGTILTIFFNKWIILDLNSVSRFSLFLSFLSRHHHCYYCQHHHQCMPGCRSHSPPVDNLPLFLPISFPFHITTATTANNPLLLLPLTGWYWGASIATDERRQQPQVVGSCGDGDVERE